MNLREYQRALLRVSLAPEADPADLSALIEARGSAREQDQDERAYGLYRHMIRTRLLGMTKVAFKQTCAALPGEAFDACFARYLAACPPRSPFIREVVADFGPFAGADRALLASGPAWLADLLGFEEHKWRLAYLPGSYPRVGDDGLRELDFEGRPVWNFSLRLLPLTYAVHLSRDGSRAEPRAATDAPEPCSGVLLMYRPCGVDEVRWYLGEPFFVALLRRSCACDESLAESVQAEAAAQKRPVDEALLEGLATSLTLALERGLLLGVR